MSERSAMEDQRRERELLQQGAQSNNSKRSQDGEGDAEKSSKKGKGVPCNSSSSNNSRPKCQVENCGADLTGVKEYYRRHRVCEQHSKARIAMVQGVQQRFCQQCSRFHVLEEFDEAKRSCRRRLQGHNERRRKTPCDALVIRPEPSHRVNGGWLKQREENERLPLMLEAGATAKVINKIKNH